MGFDRFTAPTITRYWAVSFAALLLASLGLWSTPAATSSSVYPSIAMADWAEPLADAFGYAAMPVLMLTCLGIVFFDSDSVRDRRLRCTVWLTVALMLSVGFATDQHRLQPWVYQTWLYAIIWTLLPRPDSMPLLRTITASIYFYSSIGKFDFQFIHTVGQEFLVTAIGFAGLDASTWEPTIRNQLVLAFPIVELTVAIMCLVPRTRRVGGSMAIAMHVSLLVLLSPWGMNHSLGVLIWNAVLAGQAYLLFVRLPDRHRSAELPMPSRWNRTLAVGLTGLAITLPLTERRGRVDADAWHWDHWQSWALYSPHNSRFHFEVHRRLLAGMEPSIRRTLDEDPDGDGWHTLDLGSYSLVARGVPVLPQARYQIQLAIRMAEQPGWENSVRGVLRSASDRRTGTRREEWLLGLKEMERASELYWLP